VAAVVAAGFLLEPVYHTLYLGQVNLFLMALVMTDISRVARGRTAGIGVGLAAAIKLTPAAAGVPAPGDFRCRPSVNRVMTCLAEPEDVRCRYIETVSRDWREL
jgi:Glycosyltransferase family 87